MNNFYKEVRQGVLDLSSNNNSFMVMRVDIEDLPAYKNAPQEYKDSFEGDIFAALSKGSMGKGQVKTKSLKTPFSTTTNFNGGGLEELRPVRDEIDALVA